MDAHCGLLERAHVSLVAARLVPAAAGQIVIDEIASVRIEGARCQILDRASPKHAGPMIAKQLE